MTHAADTQIVAAATPPTAPKPTRSHLRLVSEFQPDAMELEERDRPAIASITLYALLGLIATAVAWASLSHVDKIVVAQGRLVTTKPNFVVQPLETSVIRSIDVAAGDIVRAGQVLARLDSTFTQSDVGQIQEKVATLDARIMRLEAELGRGAMEIRAGAGAAEMLETKLFLQRKASFDAHMRNLGEALARAEATLATTGEEIPVLVQRVETMREIEAMRAKLFDLKSGSRLNLLQSINQRLELESSLARMRGNQIELKHAAEKARAEKVSYEEEFRRQALEDLIKSRDERAAAAEQIKKALLRKDMVELTAPADAVVLDLANRSIGSVLREAEPLLTLVPLDEPIEAEVMVEARDIGQVRTRQNVRIKFDTFPFQRHGTAKGAVRTISRDAFQAETKGQPAAAPAQPHYRARVDITEMSLRNLPEGFRQLPGMTVTAEIKVGEQRIISYLLYPIMRGLDESIREP